MLTFEKIRDLERAERDNKQLQKLPDNILDELRDYLHKKEKMEKTSSDIMELENVKNTIKRLFELREKKILDMLLYMARTGLPPENLLKGEEKFFYFVLDEMKKFREEFFLELKKEPEIKEKKVVYKVKKVLPSFIGPDLKSYNLNKNDIIDINSIPKELNDLLLKQGIIERVEE